MAPLLLLAVLASTPRIDGYVSACAVPVDGFSVPRGAAAAAAGTVRVVKGGHVEVSHCFYENAEVRVVRTVVDGLTSVEVREGAVVARRAEADDIASRWSRRAPVPQRTKLGGGIGFHGWNAPWDGADGGYGLSWGCVVMHPEEVRGFYELVPLGTTVVLL